MGPYAPGRSKGQKHLMDIQFDFSGKTVVVFGGTTGINLSIAEAFAQRGADVAVSSRKQDNVDAAVVQLAKHGGKVLGYASDVRNMESVARVFEAVRAEWGTVDVLVSGAAGELPRRSERAVVQWLQGGCRHRPERHVPRAARRV